LSDKDTIVERRQRYIERQKVLKPDSVDVSFGGQQPQGSGPKNRHGMPQLPVGQREVKNWPVLDLGHVPKIKREDWELIIDGEVENPVTLNWDTLMELPQVTDVSDFHCVTTWSRFDNHWKGVRFSTLAELVVPTEEAKVVFTTGYDRLHGSDIAYTTNLPLAKAVEPDVLLVYEWEGKPLEAEHGGPLRMITPKLYAWKGAKWIHRISFLKENKPGFWEVRGYSDSAEPWFNDRYSS
jgi:DMSO/TMAO reductase YedYZ molybdopterin-dependent catalytic subunit